MAEPSAQLALAERVAAEARELGIETALIGASALAAHNYLRGTEDVDLGTAVDLAQLARLERAIVSAGLRTKLRLPDEDDPLGGVLVVYEHEDEDGEPIARVEVVNFVNPYRPRRTPAQHAIEHAVPLDERSPLRCVRLSDLIALKLYAGSRQDLADVVELLVRNADADLDELRAIAGPHDAGGQLEQLIVEAQRRR